MAAQVRAGLQTYNRMRDFRRTAEPRGRRARSDSGRSFVVQKHDARRLHYDFRLELDGVLKSWAVPKGPSLVPGEKRLAVQTEDHPVDYGDFEGTIPEGEYGAGAVIVWDRGDWRPVGDPHEGLRKGRLSFELEGEKLRGAFSLVRLRGRGAGDGEDTWLLMKRSDEFARDGEGEDITQAAPASVKSGRTVEDVAAGRRAPARKARRTSRAVQAAKRVRRDPLPAFAAVAPQLATLVERAPHEAGWVYEMKYDGYRSLALLDRGRVRIASRNGLDWTARYPQVAADLAALGADSALIDGEVCFVTADGRTDFQQLQNALREGGAAGDAQRRGLVYFCFDLLYHDGEDLRARPLSERKARLRELLGDAGASLRYSEHLEGDGAAVLAQACALGLEGVIAKRAAQPYRSGRGKDWLKLKCQRRQEFVIVGMTAPKGGRSGLGALLLAVQDAEGLRYAGKVGTGFSDRSLRELSERLAPLRRPQPTLADAPRGRDITWVEPRLVCEVSFTELTRDGIVRHPSFEGLREDKAPAQVRVEQVQPPPTTRPRRPAARRRGRAGTAAADEAPLTVRGVRVSNPDRVMDAASGTTKGELLRYHDAVAEELLRFARGRPLALVRCPQGDAQQCFFQKHAVAGFSAAVGRQRVRGEELLHADTPRALCELAQFNVVEFHGWGARLPQVEQPDWLVMDLDPAPDVAFERVSEAAREMREALRAIGLRPFLKTTGGKGLHVVAPLEGVAGWDQVKAFTQALAQDFARRDPQRYIAKATKAARGGRIFVDYLRNARGATAILPYSPRARPGATVAVPLDWRDLAHLDPREFTVASVPALLRRRRKDPWAEFESARADLARLLGALERRH